MLRLTYFDKRPLAMPADTIKSIEGVLPSAKKNVPGARAFIRFALKGTVQTAFLENDPQKTLRRMQAQGAGLDWITLTQSAEGGAPLYISPADIRFVEGKPKWTNDAEADPHAGANAYVVLDTGQFDTYPIKETADEVLARIAPITGETADDQDSEIEDDEPLDFGPEEEDEAEKPPHPKGLVPA